MFQRTWFNFGQLLRKDIDDVLRVLRNAVDYAGFTFAQPGKADKAQTGHGRDAALMEWCPIRVEDGQVYPAEVGGEAGSPNDCADVRLLEA